MRRRSAPARAGPCCRGSRQARRPPRGVVRHVGQLRTVQGVVSHWTGAARPGVRRAPGNRRSSVWREVRLDGYSAMNRATRGELMPETQIETVETSAAPTAAEDGLVEESLVEEVSIDGMCGVY